MRILIIAYYFPPQNTIGSLRPYSWAKYFCDQGHDVTVATVKKKEADNDLDYDISCFSLVEATYKIPFKKSTNYSVNNHEKGKEPLFRKTKNIFKNLLLSFIEKKGILCGSRFPDLRIQWCTNCSKLLNGKTFDIMISTGGPYIVHSLAYKLKKEQKNIFWVLDWRDLWTQNSSFFGLKIFHLYEKRLEKKYHDAADLITTISDGLADVLKKMTRTQVQVIYNGYNPSDYDQIFNHERKINEKLVISYLGSIYKGSRDPEPLLKAIHELIIDKQISPTEICLLFAGGNSNIKDIINKYNLNECYEYLGNLKRTESLEIQYDSDVLLFLESEHKTGGILTGKLFEYLSLGREIWAIGISNTNSAGKIIEQSGLGVCLGNDVSLIKTVVLNKLKNKNVEKNVNYPLIKQFTRDNQSKRLMDIINRNMNMNSK